MHLPPSSSLPPVPTCAWGGLAPGLASEAELRAKLGAPGMSWNAPDGGKLLEYSGQPSGTFCHMIVIGPDDRLLRSDRTVVYKASGPGYTHRKIDRAPRRG